MQQPLNSTALDSIKTAQRAQAADCQIEIGASADVDMQDFRNWWKAHVNEIRYWGGGPDGVWSGAAR